MNFALPSKGYLGGPGGKLVGLDVLATTVDTKDHHYHQEVKYHL